MPKSLSVLCAAAGAAAGLLIAPPARADLREDQVLVVYDSRIADSRLVAEHYAGSGKVPGGVGGVVGARPGVHTVDLASIGGGVFPPVPDISFSTFAAAIRNPLRNHLSAAGLTHQVRSIVLTKGLPHRIQDNTTALVGDQPSQAGALNEILTRGDATYASVDSELVLLWQNLEVGEVGGFLDSRLDNAIVNPSWRNLSTIDAWNTRNITAQKTISALSTEYGPFLWRGLPPTTPTSNPASFTPGDMYLVCRLDGHTVAHVRGMIDRAQNLWANTETSLFVVDEAGSNGLEDGATVSHPTEFDNQGPSFINGGDDYERARDAVTTDRRFLPANVRYNALSGADQFLVGPLINFGGGIVTSGPVLLLATNGANHQPIPGGTPGAAATQYAASFTYAPGAVFNTMESFNGRDLGGLGLGPVPQEQIADFIAAGGTFGIGQVWEPLAATIPDNEQIVKGFLLGNMSWAEAAYASIPVLSWQQVVLGDPLARVRRAADDINADGRLDAEDLYAWQASPRDLNHDGLATATDLDLLKGAVRAWEAPVSRGARRLR